MSVELYWLPLGAGGTCVRRNGRIFEVVQARLDHRGPLDLYHAALVVSEGGARFAIEMTPVPDGRGRDRGVRGEGAVGSALAGRLRIFRYEIRCWRDGTIPDLAAAVASPVVVSERADDCSRVLALVDSVPLPVWGRDELGGGEMWTSNSVIGWLLERSGLNSPPIQPPRGGRAPGWDAGVAVARRRETPS